MQKTEIINIHEYIRPDESIFIPEWIMERPELSAGAKLCYSYLFQDFAKKGECSPTQEKIAFELGSSEKDIRKYIRELEKHSLIETVRGDHGEPDHYLFPVHEWMPEE